MSTRDDDEQAFPSEFFETEHGDRVRAFAGSPGLTKREWFAGQAMTMWRINDADIARFNQGEQPMWSNMAAACYSFADAMIEESKK